MIERLRGKRAAYNLTDAEIAQAAKSCINGEAECRGCAIRILCNQTGYGVSEVLLSVIERQQSELERIRKEAKDDSKQQRKR